jgi:hypothetical protein
MDKYFTFELYFAGIASIQYHPANPPETRMSLEECAEVADKMVKITEERLCHGDT